MSTGKQLILVTGASGFVASHVVEALLKSGYAVRGTVRPDKIAAINKAPISKKYPEDFSVVPIEDVSSADFTEALKGIHAIVHVASPMPMGKTAEENLTGAKNGNLNVLRQALKAGITKVVITGSFGATMDPDAIMSKPLSGCTLTEKDWGHALEEDFAKNEGNMVWSYLAIKILAERAAWDFAQENPALDLAVVLPPFIFGPLQGDFPIPGPSRLSSNEQMYALVYGEPFRPLGFQMSPQFVDVRDVATAHVRALSVPPAADKRYLIGGGHLIKKNAVQYLAKAHPELKERLPSIADAADIDVKTISILDTSKARKELGLDKYIAWEKTVEDATASLLSYEEFWKQTQ